MKDKKLAVFDLDGTIIDAYKSIQKTLNYSLEQMGYSPVTLEKVKKSVGRGEVDLASKLVKEQDMAELIAFYRQNHIKFIDGNVKLLEGSEELLDSLKDRGLHIALATNRAAFAVSPLLEKLNIKGYFDIIYTRDDVVNPKPDPAILLKTIAYFNTEKPQTFFVGDMDVDYLAGSNAGVDTYIVLTGSSSKEDFDQYANVNLFDNLVTLKKHLDYL